MVALTSNKVLSSALFSMLVLGAFVGFSAGHAEARVLTIAHEITVPFDPVEARMIVSGPSGSVFTTKASIARISTQGKIVVTGKVVVPESVSKLSVLSIVTSTAGVPFSAAKEIPSVSSDPQYLLDTKELSSRLSERQTVLESWKVRLAEQGSSLERLQDDADVIVNVGRIITAEDELKNINDDIERLSASLTLAQSRLEAIKNLPPPPLATRREAELSAELNELSRTLKNTEAAALQKISAASGELNANLALIEATKYQQIDPLLKELAALRRERAELESGR
jgi:hypothetical protein